MDQYTLELPEVLAAKPKTSKPYIVRKFRTEFVRESSSIGAVTVRDKRDVSSLITTVLDRPTEAVLVVALDTGNRIIGYQRHDGEVGQCAIYVPSVFRFALGVCAASVVMAHNHPGGSKQPSNADWQITNAVREAGKCLQIPLIDHLILTDGEIVSMRENRKWGNS